MIPIVYTVFMLINIKVQDTRKILIQVLFIMYLSEATDDLYPVKISRYTVVLLVVVDSKASIIYYSQLKLPVSGSIFPEHA